MNLIVSAGITGFSILCLKVIVFSIGRYGSWTYCSIEENIIEASNLAYKLS